MKNLTFIEKDDLENYVEIDLQLKKLGFTYTYNYKNIPFYSKYTICKSIGDLINLYNIKYLLRQNKIPYKKKEYIEVDDEILQIQNYKQYSYVTCNKELKRLRSLYNKTKDPIYIKQQNEVCIKKAQVDYLRANHKLTHAKQYYMLPESAIIYQNMIFALARSGDVLDLTSHNQLSTSSLVMCISYCRSTVSKGIGCVQWNKKYSLLNTTGRMLEWKSNRLRPNLQYRQSALTRLTSDKEHWWASIDDYCNYLDSFYVSLSKITGQRYPKTTFIINACGEVQFKVPSLILSIY